MKGETTCWKLFVMGPWIASSIPGWENARGNVYAGVASRFTYSITRLQKLDPEGNPTKSAHPARFSPDDKFSRERITLKKRFGILPTQLPAHEL